MDQHSFPFALTPNGWQRDTILGIQNTEIVSVDTEEPTQGEPNRHDHFAIPGMVNIHSHAFQHAFAGLSEYRTARNDSFWTWRKLMYDFLESLTPEDVFRIGLRLYREMRAAGYSAVGEFHYLLHQSNGQPYANINETADALIEAATEAGLAICMLPVLYQRGGFDNIELAGGQLRFQSTNDLFIKMVEKLKTDHVHNPRVRIGWALHSLRAVSIANAKKVKTQLDTLLPNCPIHIHVAEQTQEVNDCLKFTGRRPVQFLLENFEVDQRWCLIHATHMTDEESEAVANSKAVVGVCPTTEANLGDGIFESERFLKHGGRLAIGSDSHISINPIEELKLLEYAQRLSKQKRAILCSEDRSCGETLWRWASHGGGQASGFATALEAGTCLAFPVIPPIKNSPSRSLDHRIFANGMPLKLFDTN